MLAQAIKCATKYIKVKKEVRQDSREKGRKPMRELMVNSIAGPRARKVPYSMNLFFLSQKKGS